MEVIKWSDVFGGDVIGYIRLFCGLVITFRIISFLFQSFKQADAMIYLSKLLMHGILVIMILVCYAKSQLGIASIDVLTGFTLLFSAVEIADSFLMFIKEWFSKKVYEHFNSRNNQIDSKREENDFFEIISRLHDIQIRLHPGKVDSCMSKNITEVYEMFKCTSLYTVNLMVKHGVEEGDDFDSYMNELFNMESIRQIIAYEYHNIGQPIILNYYEYEELIETLEKAIRSKYIYLKEIEKIEENKKVEQYANSLEKIKVLEKKYFGISEVVVDKMVKLQKMGY